MKPLVCDMPNVTHRNNGGFTLVEMLVTILILTLTSTLLAMGIPVAADTYQKTVKTANAQVALSTTITVLKSELGMAQSIENEDATGRVRYRTSEGYMASIGNAHNTDGNHVSNGLDKKYLTETGSEAYDYGLISDSAITNDLRVVCDSIAKVDGSDEVIVTNLRVYDVAKPANPLAKVAEYRILTRCDN